MLPNNPFATGLNAMDMSHVTFPFFTGDGPDQTMVWDIWAEKYRWGDEKNLTESARRICGAIYENDKAEHANTAFYAMDAGLLVPAGRIWAGAGTGKRVTLMNCYVNMTVQDSMDHIHDALKAAALTMQMGGGIGTDFSTIRPSGAFLNRTFTAASGPIPFMHEWAAMCSTIRSAGDRRGAMMGTICDTHPDLPLFIKAKSTHASLTNFNVSVLVSDAFMEAIAEDAEWVLHFPCKPMKTRSADMIALDFIDENDIQQYVYSIWKARDLWEMILKNTYEYSEPGVIFIDRVNSINNLHYREHIHCTNPCGEQPLPPNATCNLGHVNLARMVMRPFQAEAHINWALLKTVTQTAVRFLDNVIDTTLYPLKEQADEEFATRRTGLGSMGMADMLAQLQLRYGSVRAADVAEEIKKFIAITAYQTSIDLAKERGSFPAFNAEGLLAPNTFISRRMPEEIKEQIRGGHLRNGVILTDAPTGTISIIQGEVSGGLEPVFSHEGFRRVRQNNDDVWKTYPTKSYISRFYEHVNGPVSNSKYPSYMVVSDDLTPNEHVMMQARIQRWVDASVSKTVNCPKDISYEAFKDVYDQAYSSGCKGCTTYRPSDVRGAILMKENPDLKQEGTKYPLERPEILFGQTHKIKWPHRTAALYLTVNVDEEGYVHEVFIQSKDARDSEWTMALTLMITGILRKGGEVGFISRELQQIKSVGEGAWVKGKYFASLPALIGYILDKHLNPDDVEDEAGTIEATTTTTAKAIGKTCPQCSAPSLINESGCERCLNCSYSKC